MPSAARQTRADQLDMFGQAVVQPVKAQPPRPEFSPFPESLVRSLNADLRRLYRCEALPWTPAQLARRDAEFRACVAELHPDWRGDLIERWDAEIARLQGSTAA